MKEKLSIEEVVAADGSGKVLPNANERLDGFVYVAKREELCRKARLKPWLFAVFLLTLYSVLKNCEIYSGNNKKLYA